jgi:hypothetical protein
MTEQVAGRPGSLSDALRTVGLWLEVSAAPHARLTLDAEGVYVNPAGGHGDRWYSWADLAGRARALQAGRRPAATAAPWLKPFALSRWSVLLRHVGQLLAAEGVQGCTIEAAVAPADRPLDCRVQARVNGEIILDTEAVRTLVWTLEVRAAAPR